MTQSSKNKLQILKITFSDVLLNQDFDKWSIEHPKNLPISIISVKINKIHWILPHLHFNKAIQLKQKRLTAPE